MKPWTPKKPLGKWRDFLTAEELIAVASAERESREAKDKLAAATARLNPIRQRASQRALHAERTALGQG